jgi:bifunctional DNA-binding transcriptional regulator/antitoxin component of YhaV-PrlF toxin-antitoxin module
MKIGVKLYKSGSSMYVTIPKPMRQYLGWNHGDDLIATIQADKSLRLTTLELSFEEDFQRRLSELRAKEQSAHA